MAARDEGTSFRLLSEGELKQLLDDSNAASTLKIHQILIFQT